MSGECLFTHLSMQLSIPAPPLLSRSQRSQTPAVDSAHVPGLIPVGSPWRRGARRRQPCQRAFKGTPDPRRKKKRESRWQRGMTPPMHCTCSPQAAPRSLLLLLRLPGLPFNQCPMGASGGFELEECLNAAPVHAASHHKAPEGPPGPPPTHFFVTNRGKVPTLPLLCATKKQLAC